jgi:ribonuclease T1
MRAALAALLVVCSTALALSGSVGIGELPPEARRTLEFIEAGGPFPYERDGAVFSNRERRLPPREHGYYREYTVKTPGVRDRGPRRIVAGHDGDYYYTDDHYRTFRRIIRP